MALVVLPLASIFIFHATKSGIYVRDDDPGHGRRNAKLTRYCSFLFPVQVPMA
jgi:hypothetical protein